MESQHTLPISRRQYYFEKTLLQKASKVLKSEQIPRCIQTTKLSQENINVLSNTIVGNEMDLVIKNLSNRISPGTDL